MWQDQTWPDNWTAVTTDGKLSAQFEQTMVVTESAPGTNCIKIGLPGKLILRRENVFQR